MRTEKRCVSMADREYYEVLGIEKQATAKQIKEAYRRLALRYHPDRNRDNPEAATRMKEINEAYAVLSDPRKRTEYERMREAYGSSAYTHFRQTYSDQDIFRGSDIHTIFEEMSRMFGFRSFEAVFRESYGPTYRSFDFKRPGVFGRIVITPGGKRGIPADSFLQGYFGKALRHSLRKKWGMVFPESGRDVQDRITVSPALALSGGKIRYVCRHSGREFRVTVPQNMRSGQRIRLKGMGEPGKDGGPPGDLYVKVFVRSPLLPKIGESLKRLKSALLDLLAQIPRGK
jgi:DnaJ-class molecular chaperone